MINPMPESFHVSNGYRVVKILGAVFWVSGLGIMASAFRPGADQPVSVVVFGLAFFAVGFSLGLGWGSARVDPSSRTLTVRSGVFGFFRRKVYPFGAFSEVQLS